MINAFYFTLKSLVFSMFLRYLKFYCAFFVHVVNTLINKLRLISEFMMPQPSKQIITIHTANHFKSLRQSQ